MSELLDMQLKFGRMLPLLLNYVHSLGYEYKPGKALAEQDDPTIHPHSLHKLALAIDLHVFKDGEYLTDTEDYQQLGEYWEYLGGSWGGRFSKPDGNHFSLAYRGMR